MIAFTYGQKNLRKRTLERLNTENDIQNMYRVSIDLKKTQVEVWKFRSGAYSGWENENLWSPRDQPI